METEEMKTFVVEYVLWDYTPGLIVVKAKDKEEAIKLIMKELNYHDFYEDCISDKECGEYFSDNDSKGCLKCKLRELKDNEVVYVYGGG